MSDELVRGAVPVTATFLFTDIEGSTRLWQQDPVRMAPAVAGHDALLRQAVESFRGRIVKTTGDGIYAAFAQAPDALAAATTIQRALMDPGATAGMTLRVRCGIHTGIAEFRDADYFGDAVNRAARIMDTAYGGQVLLSDAVARLCQRQLPDGVSLRDLGAVRLRDLADPERVHQIVHPSLRQDFPALRSLASTPNNLPQQASTFIGRQRELDEIRDLFEQTRMLTLLGAGGLGKTRLSLQLAAEVMDGFADGAWLVELAPLRDARLVPQAVAAVLGVGEEVGRPALDVLIEHVRERQLLLVLDNCEHLLRACAQLASDLLRAGARVRILASSREPLHIAGETTYPLPPLSMPEPGATIDADSMSNYDAVHLFCIRARGAKPDFRLTSGNARIVVDICRRLDGIPLAIELAAARLRALALDQIDQRLGDRFHLLTGGDQTALPRQQTLRACIDWSYELLCDAERMLLQQLAVFAGGFTLEAAEAVTADRDVRREDVLELLVHLVEKSLVELDGESGRYRLLETIRDYANVRLVECGMAAAARVRHRDHFVAIAEQSEPAMMGGADQARWLERLDLESDNLRGALAQSLAADGDARQALRLCGALYRYWIHRGNLREARAWCEQATALEVDPRDPACAKALLGAGAIAYRQGDYGAAQEMLERALAGAGQSDAERTLRARILNNLGNIATDQGDIPRALERYRQAAALARDAGPKSLEAMILSNLGQVTLGEGDIAAAKRVLERALDLAVELEDRVTIGGVLAHLSNAALYANDVAGALALTERALDAARAIGERGQVAVQISSKGELLAAMGEPVAARTLLEEALVQHADVGWPLQLAACFDSIARAALVLDEFERAARIIGIADAIRASMANKLLKMEAMLSAADFAACSVALGKARAERAWMEGNALPADVAVAETLAWLRQ